MRQVAKPTPKAIKKKANNDCSSLGFSARVMVETEVLEESATATGVETKFVVLSAVFVPSVSVVGSTTVVGVAVVDVVRVGTDDSAVVIGVRTDNGDSVLSFTWFSVWSSLFFFQKRLDSHQLLLQV